MKFLKIYLVIFLLVAASGCISVAEYVRIVFGTSTRELSSLRKEAITSEFNIPYNEAFKQIQAILKSNKCTIFYANIRKGVIVAMNFKDFIDTSEAGIFLTKIDPSKTKIEITSQSQNLANAASKIIFPQIGKT